MNNFQKSFRKIKTKNKNPTYLPIFFRSIIWEPEKIFAWPNKWKEESIEYMYLYNIDYSVVSGEQLSSLKKSF